MKKACIIILLAALLLCFSACDEVNPNGETNDTTGAQEASADVTAESTEPETDNTGSFNPNINITCSHMSLVNNVHITQNATCETEGEQTYTCILCSKEVTEPIPALGHEVVIDNAMSPSCTQDGKREGSHCSRCKEVLVEQEVIPALGGEHIMVLDEAVEATCTQTGLSEGKHCSRCGKVYVLQVEISKKEHDMGDWIVDKEVTCTENGKKHRQCKNCNYYEEEDTTSPHAYTITEGNGKNTFKCNQCGRMIENVENINILLQGNGDHTYTVEVSGGYGKIVCDWTAFESFAVCGGTYSQTTQFSFGIDLSFELYRLPDRIKIEATDELGQQAVYVFKLPTAELISFENTILTG